MLHTEKEVFATLLGNISHQTGIAADILEKDYYVCLVLEELAGKQDDLNAYFKGGTSIYKRIDEMRRFSEDIDLTVRNDENISNTQNKKKFEESAKGYCIENLTLTNTDNRKGSITAFYNYESVLISTVLDRAGEIQVEATSFTKSEPLEKCVIAPLIYKYADDNQKSVLSDRFAISEFEIKMITLERTFTDKLFAAQKYYMDLSKPELSRPIELAKHFYDIIVLFNQPKIQEFLNNEAEVKRIESIRRVEEKERKGGVPDNLSMRKFIIFNSKFDDKAIKAFERMQSIYLLHSKYEYSIEQLYEVLSKIVKKLPC